MLRKMIFKIENNELIEDYFVVMYQGR